MSVKSLSSASKGAISKSQSNPSLTSASTAKPKTPTSGLSVFKNMSISSSPSTTAATSGAVNKTTKKDDVKTVKEDPAILSGVQEIIAMDGCSRSIQIEQYLIVIQDASTSVAQRLIKAEILSKVTATLGVSSTEGDLVIQSISFSSFEHPQQSIREGAVVLAKSLLKLLGRIMEPFLLPLLPHLISMHADRSQVVRDSAAAIGSDLMQKASPFCFREKVFPAVTGGMTHEDWRVKVAALTFLRAIAPRVSKQMTPLLPELIPRVSECIYDSKKQVQTTAIDTLTEACAVISNEDIRPLVPQLVSVIAHPDESIKTLDCLLETTFVANVDAPVLALIAPLLGKSLKSRSSVMKRKASKVIDIMCRLVQEPSHVAPFMPLLLPALDKVIDELVDAEVCEVAKAARAILLKAMGEGLDKQADPASPTAADASLSVEKVQAKLSEALVNSLNAQIVLHSSGASAPATHFNATERSIFSYIADLCADLTVYGTVPNPNLSGPESSSSSSSGTISGTTAVNSDDFWRFSVAMTDTVEWMDCIVPYILTIHNSHLTTSSDSDTSPEEKGNSAGFIMRATDNTISEQLAMAFRKAALGDVSDNQNQCDPNDSNLCDIEFSLAFGGKILLHNTNLRLGKGRRYGLMGKNGAGKTTLLTNIGSGNIEGLPTTLKTVYVQHDDATDDKGVSMIDEMMAGKDMIEANIRKEDAEGALVSIGFTDAMLQSPRSMLSGGWKMKLLIIRAMLAKADVLLLDEPTNHLDANSVSWLIQYILAQKDLTCLIVSHDTQFMDAVLTDVIHYESRKLVYYHGNLTHFVATHPEARYYYELAGSTLSFKFPTPERLDGINSTTRSVLKIENCTYTYPGRSVPQLTNVSVKVCLASRVAVVGANGAGKSTMIKLLVQEVEPDPDCGGTVWKHMNLRVAYVAQHSFHHIEQHLDTTPVDYIKWRFSAGYDKEDMSKVNTKMTEEEVEERKAERKYGDIDMILGRRKNGRTMEYECTFVGQNPAREPNKYIAVEKLVEMGYQKLVQQCDTRIAAAAAGLDLRPLLTAEIQGHLDDFNLESEFGTHGTIRRLSGGQKVKLVLASAMWNRPHVIILDEPTNYLDREALGALTQAIKSFAGGIVIISHNQEFTDALCTERWLVRDGQCYTQGGAEEVAMKSSSMKKSTSLPADLDNAALKEDASGNTNSSIVSEVILNPKTLESLSKKELRKLERCAAVAGMTVKDYVLKINCKSPEWKWL